MNEDWTKSYQSVSEAQQMLNSFNMMNLMESMNFNNNQFQQMNNPMFNQMNNNQMNQMNNLMNNQINDPMSKQMNNIMNQITILMNQATNLMNQMDNPMNNPMMNNTMIGNPMMNNQMMNNQMNNMMNQKQLMQMTNLMNQLNNNMKMTNMNKNNKINLCFSTMQGSRVMMFFSPDETVENILKKYLLRVNLPNLINKIEGNLIFILNAQSLKFGDKRKLKDLILSMGNANNVLVNDIHNLIGAYLNRK